jgi:hypothetical protein
MIEMVHAAHKEHNFLNNNEEYPINHVTDRNVYPVIARVLSRTKGYFCFREQMVEILLNLGFSVNDAVILENRSRKGEIIEEVDAFLKTANVISKREEYEYIFNLLKFRTLCHSNEAALISRAIMAKVLADVVALGDGHLEKQ